MAKQFDINAEIRRLQKMQDDPDCGARRDWLDGLRNQDKVNAEKAKRCNAWRNSIQRQIDALIEAGLASQELKADEQAELLTIRAERDVAQTAITGETKAGVFAGVLDTLVMEAGDVVGAYLNPASVLGGGSAVETSAPTYAPPPPAPAPGVVDWIKANPVPSTAIGVALLGAAYLATR